MSAGVTFRIPIPNSGGCAVSVFTVQRKTPRFPRHVHGDVKIAAGCASTNEIPGPKSSETKPMEMILVEFKRC